jgi:hypothetical protein
MSAYLTPAQADTIRTWIATGAAKDAAGTPLATDMAKTNGDNQTGAPATALPTPLTVTVRDNAGNPVPRVIVVWTVTAGNGSLSAARVESDAQGRSSTILTLGPVAGTNTVTAMVTGLNGAPATFTATGGTVSAYSGEPLKSSTNPLDVAGLVALEANNIEPSGLADDSEFLRRVTSVTLGRLPTTAELSAFLADASPMKRENVIDSLLASNEFGENWARNHWGPWTGVSPRVSFTGDHGKAFQRTFRGNNQTNMADRLLSAFAGMSSQCARCHDHPLTTPLDDPRWNQDDNYGLYAFFATSSTAARKRDKEGRRFGDPLQPALVVDGYANAPTPGVTLADPVATRQAKFAELFTASDAFYRGTAHRIWGELGTPLLNPNQFLQAELAGVQAPALLDALEQLLRDQGGSLKGFLRVALSSKLFQLTSEGQNTTADPYQGRYVMRRHHSEVVEVGVHQLAGVTMGNSNSTFRRMFGFPDNRSNIASRVDDVNFGQALVQMNSSVSITGKVTNSGSVVRDLANMVDGGTITFDEAVIEVFRAGVSRDPSATELSGINQAKSSGGVSNRVMLEDVAAALGASAEFVFR